MIVSQLFSTADSLFEYGKTTLAFMAFPHDVMIGFRLRVRDIGTAMRDHNGTVCASDRSLASKLVHLSIELQLSKCSYKV
jgi:hypothetical protein